MIFFNFSFAKRAHISFVVSLGYLALANFLEFFDINSAFAISFACVCNSYAQKVNIEFITPEIVHVQLSSTNEIKDNGTGMCVYKKGNVKVEREENEKEITYTSNELKVNYNKLNHGISFQSHDNVILNQVPQSFKYEPSIQERVIYDEKSAHVEETANGKVTVKDIIRRDTIGVSTRYFVSFYSNGEKALYGLGAHMEDYMNLQGKTLFLTQHNLKAMVPMLCSTNGYGLLFDAGCAMKFLENQRWIKIWMQELLN